MSPVVAVLAVQRLTQLIVEDEITRPVRDRVVAWGDAHEQGSLPERLSYLVSCSACASIWSAAAVLVLRRHRVGRLANSVLAASGAALAVQAVIERLDR